MGLIKNIKAKRAERKEEFEKEFSNGKGSKEEDE